MAKEGATSLVVLVVSARTPLLQDQTNILGSGTTLHTRDCVYKRRKRFEAVAIVTIERAIARIRCVFHVPGNPSDDTKPHS
jgi:hypothetical protein